jgi:hypothetical protein
MTQTQHTDNVSVWHTSWIQSSFQCNITTTINILPLIHAQYSLLVLCDCLYESA